MKLKNLAEWKRYSKGELPEKGIRPGDIPSNPHITYKEQGWAGYCDWLGTDTVFNRRKFLPFAEAREFARGLKLKNQAEWRRYAKGEMPEKGIRPRDIPSNPHVIYKGKGWIRIGDWLGTRRQCLNWRPFEEARKFARGLGLNDSLEWYKYCKGDMAEKGVRPDDIPTNPHRTYKDQGWIGYGDWLGTGRRRINWRPFKEARDFVRSLGLKNYWEWLRYCKGEMPEKGTKPDDIPMCPYSVYKNQGWAGSRDWLGTIFTPPPRRNWLPFKEARKFARGLGFKTLAEWKRYSRGALPKKGVRPRDIPSNPNLTYKNKGWISYRDWLGIL